MNPISRKKSLLVQEVGSEIVILDKESNRIHHLNPTAAFIWQNCDRNQSLAELSESLQKEFGLAESDEQIIRAALEELHHLRLIEPHADSKERPNDDRNADSVKPKKLTRREMGIRLAAAAALPLIVSIAVPAPAQAASQAAHFCPPGTVPGSSVCPNG
jgi:hypothetical protein